METFINFFYCVNIIQEVGDDLGVCVTKLEFV